MISKKKERNYFERILIDTNSIESIWLGRLLLMIFRGKHFATCTVALSGLTLFSDMYGSSWYLWIVCTSFATCTVPAKYALPFFGTCTVETPARKCYYIQPYWIAIWRHYLNYSSLGLTKIKTNMAGKHYLELSDSILKACYKVQTLFYFYLFISFQYFVRLGLGRLGLG